MQPAKQAQRAKEMLLPVPRLSGRSKGDMSQSMWIAPNPLTVYYAHTALSKTISRGIPFQLEIF